MNTSQKGDRFALHIKQEAEARGLPVVKVRSSGHMGRRGGIAADVVVAGYRIEAKNFRGGIGSKACEDILFRPRGMIDTENGRLPQFVHAVAHKRDRGQALITMSLNDWLDLVAKGSE